MKRILFSVILLSFLLLNPVIMMAEEGEEQSDQTTSSTEEVENTNEETEEHSNGEAESLKEEDDNTASEATKPSTEEGVDSASKETESNTAEEVNLNLLESSSEFTGLVINEDVPVYAEPSKDSETVETLSQGDVLPLADSDDDWYIYASKDDSSVILGYVFQDNIEALEDTDQSFIGVAKEEETHVYEKATISSEPIKSYSTGSILQFNSFSSDWYEATVWVDGEKHTGYIHRTHIELPAEEPVSLSGVATQSPTHVFSKASTSASTLKSYSQGSILRYKTFTDDWYEATVYVNGEAHTGYIHTSHVEEPAEEPVSLSGVATQSPTHVFSKASTSASTLKSYSQGSILRYKTFTDDWYEATVYVDGKAHTGYIHKNHVAEPADNPVNLSGVALQSPTNVFSKASTSASVLKSYSQGSILKYKTFTDDWYEATVYLDGEAHTGYIHKSHVEEPTDDPVQKEEIALNKSTHVYSQASKDSAILKSYQAGSLLKFETFTDNWYKATVFIDGERKTGYIQKNDVEAPDSDPESLEGIAYKSIIHVYNRPNRELGVRKSYREGSLLKYESYLSDWYKASVIVDGNRYTGYIHKDDVMDPDKEQTSKSGIAIKPTTYVYAETSTGSGKLKGYKLGANLRFTTYTQNWYKASVIIDGNRHTGYIYKRDVADQIQAKSIVNPRQTYSYSDMVRDIQELEKTYPGLIETEVIGKSVHNRNIYLVKLGVGDTKITVNASHHAREWITTNLTMYQMDQYAQAFANNSSFQGEDVRDILAKTTIYFVPMVNPDGVTLNQSGANGFSNRSALIQMNNGSTNFTSWKANGRGVDLNRQYPDGWEELDADRKSPAYAHYKGPSPLSEPESKAVYDLAMRNNFESHVAYHSSGEVIYWSYNATGSQLQLNRQIANMISNKTGYRPIPPSPRANGSGYTDWVIGTLKKPGFTVEVSPYVVERPVPLSNFNRIWNQNDTLPLLMAKEAYLRASR